MDSDEHFTVPPLPRHRYSPSGHPLPDLPPDGRLPSRQPQRGLDRALPPGPSAGAWHAVLIRSQKPPPVRAVLTIGTVTVAIEIAVGGTQPRPAPLAQHITRAAKWQRVGEWDWARTSIRPGAADWTFAPVCQRGAGSCRESMPSEWRSCADATLLFAQLGTTGGLISQVGGWPRQRV
jgi:hypothetical protein